MQEELHFREFHNWVRQTHAELEAASEDSRRCLVDNEKMEKQIFEYVLIDRCPACGGVWLDQGELEVIKETVKSDATFAGLVLGWLIG